MEIEIITRFPFFSIAVKKSVPRFVNPFFVRKNLALSLIMGKSVVNFLNFGLNLGN